jgi:Asp-tRNA(Asn)/Glu-tRNA(Gln) amidotransferase A subunit family amidase
VPILMKDLGATCAGVPYTAGSKVLTHYVPDHDSEHTLRLKRAGLLILGVANVLELGSNASTAPDLYGPTRNPGTSRARRVARVAARQAAVAAAMQSADNLPIGAHFTARVRR